MNQVREKLKQEGKGKKPSSYFQAYAEKKYSSLLSTHLGNINGKINIFFFITSI